MNALADLKNRLWERWHALGERDRLLLALWGIGVALLLLWFGLVSPVYRRIVVLEQRVPDLESRLNRMRAESADMSPSGHVAHPADGDLRSTLFGVLAQRKLAAELRALSTTRVEMRLPELALGEALDVLETLRQEAGCRVAALTVKSDKPTGNTARIVVELERLP